MQCLNCISKDKLISAKDEEICVRDRKIRDLTAELAVSKQQIAKHKKMIESSQNELAGMFYLFLIFCS